MVPKLNAGNPVTTAVNIQLTTRCTPALLRPPFLSSATRHTHMWENADTSTFLAHSVLIELSHGLLRFPWTKSCSIICHHSFQIHHDMDLSAFQYLPLTLLNFTFSCGEGPARGRGIAMTQRTPVSSFSPLHCSARARLGVCSPSVFSCQAPPKPALPSELFPPVVRLLS